MSLPSWSPLARHRAAFELSREDGGPSTVERQRRADGIKDRNALTPAEAIATVRAIRSKALSKHMPDSTPAIRADRDER